MAPQRVPSSMQAACWCTTVDLYFAVLPSLHVFNILQLDVGQNPVPPVNLKVDGHPLYHMISRF